eukprot:TRINITY_DN37022_c0_g1_i1.p1 TRINITY_DN37022_c0_g1~~TRINITY_DN37022_c0_g1_i1.p1  ORF type:complete len:391 (+),score=73.21 TRINITY_DN37022_c0_g1_i1:51-1175(+)
MVLTVGRTSDLAIYSLFALGALASSSISGQRHLLSEEPLIELRANFISKAEVEAIRELAEREEFEDAGDVETSGSASFEISGGQELCKLNFSDVGEDSDSADLWAAARRLAGSAISWAGGSTSLDMDPHGLPAVFVARWETWRAASALNRSGPLHLDLRKQPRRKRTVLVYLSGEGDAAADGSTVFPCIKTVDMSAEEGARRLDLCRRAAAHIQWIHNRLLAEYAKGMPQLPPDMEHVNLEQNPELSKKVVMSLAVMAALPKETSDGVRPVNWVWPPKYDEIASDGLSLHALSEAMCRGKAPGLRVASREGDALLMDTMEAGSTNPADGVFGKPDWRLWHAGCSSSDTAGPRWTAQLFLEKQTVSAEQDCKTNL